ASCDEFIFYDDLVRDAEKQRKRRPKHANKKTAKKAAVKGDEEKRQEALDLVLETVEDLFEERGEEEKVWGSMVKQALKRRKPGFNESYHGYRSFGQLLEEAQERGLLTLEYDEKSGGYIIKGYSAEG
ncbi:MAG TPA: OST-HTH/LOTUS domain-containing protein, partial [Gammaproteobacteria bacterium]|nr:OST-HTH/LOTUS domain-containing protein [Gammaproteobacteria bacterium]